MITLNLEEELEILNIEVKNLKLKSFTPQSMRNKKRNRAMLAKKLARIETILNVLN